MKKKIFETDDIERISNEVSCVDYFFYLERKGVVKFDRKTGHDHYFLTENNKFSVTDEEFYDFKTGQGGKIIKAVMDLENKSWREAIDFLKEFSNTEIFTEINAEKRKNIRQTTENKPNITKIFTPNNQALLTYFEERGISNDVLQKHTKQVHYKQGETEYFGIGLQNQSNGYEIRNPYIKTKLGKSDISIIGEGNNKKQIVVFEGMTDMLSFLQLLKDNNRPNNYTLVVLNSVTNVDNFIHNFQNHQGKINLILDGDKAGNEATQKILESFKNIKVEDCREKYGISETGIQDLNDYLKNKLKNNVLQEKNSTLAIEEDNSQNQTQDEQSIEPTRVSAPQSMGSEAFERNFGNFGETSQSQQSSDNGRGQILGSNDARDGLDSSEQLALGGRGRLGFSTNDRTQQEILRTEETYRREEHQGDRANISDRNGHRNQGDGSNKLANLGQYALLDKYQGQKINNEQIKELVDALTYVEDSKIQIAENVEITDKTKNLVSQYKSGGVAKEGRGVLDEYYTDENLVNAVGNLIRDNFKGKKEINILEPSVGTGNFLQAIEQLTLKKNVTAFEINETTAKIAKILNPNAQIYLRSFESEFITDNGQKKDFEEKYDLVIGNPPYGEHRGLYKGLGEEPKISKYEDYFVKRSLDVMKEGGTLAMVLPSSWLNRQKKLQGAELKEAYRLPNGVFKATGVGTDIVILQKNSQKLSHDISNYFDENQSHILGNMTQKTNRFGKLEDYVKGNLTEALLRLDSLHKKETLEQLNKQLKAVPVQLNLFDMAEEQVVESTQKTNLDNEIEEAKGKVIQALDVLNDIKFKSISVMEEIENYTHLKFKLENTPDKFTAEELKDISKKADNFIKLKKEKNAEKEYTIQTIPEIKKGTLKYHFKKNDEVVDTSLQSKINITDEELLAFKNTDYDGKLKNRSDGLAKYANLYKNKYIHDFYYTEGDIYEKLEQLVKDFRDKIDDSKFEKQYEKQKALLESVLPPKKALEDIIISPNHEFVHKFSLGKVEKEILSIGQYNPFNGRPIYEKS